MSVKCFSDIIIAVVYIVIIYHGQSTTNQIEQWLVYDVGMQCNIHMHFTDDDDDDDDSDQYLFVTTSAKIIHLFIHFI